MGLKNVLNKISIILIFIGIFILIIQPMSPTGAVIDTSTTMSKISFFIGLLVFLVGVVVFMYTRGHRVKPLDAIMSEDKGFEEKVVYVVDSSGAIDYTKNWQDKESFKKLLNQYRGRVFVPKRVIEELGKSPYNERLLKLLKATSVRQVDPKAHLKNHRKLRKLAREHLEATFKHQEYLDMKNFIETGELPKGMKDPDQYRLDLEKDLDMRIRNSEYDPDKEITNEDRLKMLKQRYRVSKGDVDVLTTALHSVAKGKRTRILARDCHLKDAVRTLLKEKPALKPYLEYVDYDMAA